MLKIQERRGARDGWWPLKNRRGWYPGHLEPEDACLLLREKWVRTGTDVEPVQRVPL